MSTRYAAVVLLVALAGCGYHFAGTPSGLPDDVHALSVGTIHNQSREHGLEKTLAFALEREIHLRRHFQMVEDPGGGDAVLSANIRALNVRPVAFNANDQAVQYEIALIVDLTLTRQQDGRVLWQVSGLRETDEYSTSAGSEVASASQFQRGTLDAANLRDPQLSPQFAQNPQSVSVQLAETERRRAIARLLNQAARDIYNQMVENF